MEKINIEKIPINEINNVKPIGEHWDKQDDLFKHKVEKYKKILKRGAMPPIVIDRSNQIFDGQCRYQAHKELRRKYILCIRRV